MTNRNSDKHEEYTRYAEHCLAMARIAPSQESRVIQREMAAEWLRLAGTPESEQAEASIPIQRLNASYDD
jgi:hypothetical protein